MKKWIFATMAILTIFAMLGCDNGSTGGGGGGGGKKSRDAELTKVTVGSQELDGFNLGDPSAAWDSVDPGTIDLASTDTGTLEVIVEKSSSKASVKYARVLKADVAAQTTAPVFGSNNEFDFNDGDLLAIEVTAQNGKTKLIYKFNITQGRNIDISALSIGSVNVTNMPSPALTAEGAVVVQLAMKVFHTGVAYDIGLTKGDTAQTVSFANVTGTAAPNETTGYTEWTSTAKSITPADGSFLYIRVIAENGDTKAYYKLQINFELEVTIKFGTPKLIDGANTEYIDPIWNSKGATVNIVRPGIEAGEDFIADPDHSAVVKLLWDDDGLWVFAVVSDPNISESAATSNHHEKDSVEVFINEYLPAADSSTPVSYNNYGGQYRIGANGEKSSDPGAAAAVYNPLPSNSWKDEANNEYTVIFQVPWRFKDTYALADNKLIGLDIQVNCARETGDSRYGVLTWNKVDGQCYQNLLGYGKGTLDLDGNSLRTEVKAPAITKQPEGKVYTPSATIEALEVETAALDAGTTQTYQWYVADAIGETGVEATGTGATAKIFTPDITSEGVYYYYVVITNNDPTATNDDRGDFRTKTLKSAYATVVIYDGEILDKIKVVNAAFPIFKFVLPAGAVWADYEVVSADYKFDAENFAKSTRTRVYGNLYHTTNPFDLRNNYSNWNYGGGTGINANNHYILNNAFGSNGDTATRFNADPLNTHLVSAAPEADEWFTLNLDISGAAKLGDYNDANLPSAAAGDTIYLAFGFTTPNDGSASSVSYDMTNVTLVNKTSSTLNIVTSGADFLGFAANMDSSFGDQERQVIFTDLTPQEWVVFSGSEKGGPWLLAEGPTAGITGAQYSAGIVIPIPSTYDVRNYTKFTIEVKGYDKDEEPFTLTWGSAQAKFHTGADTTSANSAAIGGQVSNIGANAANTENINIPTAVINSVDPILFFSIQTSNGNSTPENIPPYLELVKLTFHDPK